MDLGQSHHQQGESSLESNQDLTLRTRQAAEVGGSIPSKGEDWLLMVEPLSDLGAECSMTSLEKPHWMCDVRPMRGSELLGLGKMVK